MMKNLGKFTFYTPDNPAASHANHLKNEDGADWYSISWDKDRTASHIYAGTDDTGKIICITDNGAMFFPGNMTVWAIQKDEAPANILTNGYDATIIDGKHAVDYVSIAQRQRQVLLSEATRPSQTGQSYSWEPSLMTTKPA